VYRTITVIGLGTLGGFLCKHLSEMEELEELIIIDDDIVEVKNVFKSIYRSQDVGEYKVDAMSNLISNNISVKKIKSKYIDGKTKIKSTDLVIDCRDIVCDRSNDIDVRFYISEKILIIDCRKNVRNVCSYEGGYRTQLNKSEINKAAFFAAQTVFSGQLYEMTKNNMVQRINLDLVSSVMDKSIRKNLKNKLDIIYDLAGDTQRLQCIEENIKPILRLNRSSDIDVFVGSKSKNYKTIERTRKINLPVERKTNYTLIPRNSLNSSLDVIQRLTEIVKKQPGISNFIISVTKDENNNSYIELIEETGAA